MPKTTLGKWSVGLIVIMPVLFAISFLLTDTLYESVASGETILQDIAGRPVLALSMLTGMVCGIAAFITGIITIVKRQERGLLVYVSTILGLLVIFFLIGEFVSPH
jgi:hypothetical protein